MYPHDFSYISLLTSWPFIYLKTSLRQQGKCCKATVRLCSHRAAWQAAGSESASGSDNVWQQQGLLRTAWKCCCVVFSPALKEQSEKGAAAISLCSLGGYLLDVLTLPLPLQEEHGINPLQGELHWSCPLRIFTWPFRGATIVSEGTALDAGDQGYCL